MHGQHLVRGDPGQAPATSGEKEDTDATTQIGRGRPPDPEGSKPGIRGLGGTNQHALPAPGSQTSCHGQDRTPTETGKEEDGQTTKAVSSTPGPKLREVVLDTVTQVTVINPKHTTLGRAIDMGCATPNQEPCHPRVRLNGYPPPTHVQWRQQG